jgi:polyhydroxyalkanoic acid synthase PhaR subunit
MSGQSRQEAPNPFDPFGAWKQMRDANMDSWSKAMLEFVNSEQYTQATSAVLDQYLTMSQPFQRALETTMTRTLTMLNMPTRAEVTGLSERLTNIELRLDDLDAKLDEVLAALKTKQGEGA